MSFEEREIRDRLMVAIGATSDIENIYVRRRAAKAAAPEVLAILREHAHELAEKQRAAEAQWRQSGYEGTRSKGWLIDLIDPEVSE